MANGNLHTLTTVLSLLLQRRGNSYGRYAPNDLIHCVRPTTKGNVQLMKESVSYNGDAFTLKSASLGRPLHVLTWFKVCEDRIKKIYPKNDG